MEKFTKDLLKALDKARRFPMNTCPASRHTQMIGESLAREKPCPMLQEEPEHCGGSLLSTVLSLYEARTKIGKLEAALRPFAEVADDFDADGRELKDSDGIYANTAGDFRRARVALGVNITSGDQK